MYPLLYWGILMCGYISAYNLLMLTKFPISLKTTPQRFRHAAGTGNMITTKTPAGGEYKQYEALVIASNYHDQNKNDGNIDSLINSKGLSGRSALDKALENGHYHLALLLLQWGARPTKDNLTLVEGLISRLEELKSKLKELESKNEKFYDEIKKLNDEIKKIKDEIKKIEPNIQDIQDIQAVIKKIIGRPHLFGGYIKKKTRRSKKSRKTRRHKRKNF
jgi:predicted transcriptional regulator